MSGQKSETISPFFEDQPVKLRPGLVPDTIMFKCPGDMCKDNNNNAPEKAKTADSSCPPKPECKTVEPMEEQKPKPTCKDKEQNKEENPPCKNLPETQNFKCTEPPANDGCNGGKKAEDKKDEGAKQCSNAGTPVAGKRNCKCGTPVAPRPKPCGCNKGGMSCGPNTSCETIPLSMKNKAK